MAYTFTITLTDSEVAALCARGGYRPMLPNPARDPNERRQRPEVPNPVSPEQFAQQMVEASIEKIEDDHIGQQAMKDSYQQAVAQHRAQHPRRRDRKARDDQA